MTEQPNEVTLEEGQDETEDSGQVDWEKKVAELEANNKSLQAEFTRKSQRLAEIEKEKESSKESKELSQEEVDLKQWIRKEVIEEERELRNKELEAFKTQQQMEAEFSGLLQYYPDLSQHEQAIRDLQKPGSTFEQTAIKYGFTSEDKITKAKASRGKMVGTDTKGKSEQKPLSEASLEEYAKRKKEGGLSGKNGFKKAKSF